MEGKPLKGKEAVESRGEGEPWNPTGAAPQRVASQVHSLEMGFSPEKEGVLPLQSLRIKGNYLNT